MYTEKPGFLSSWVPASPHFHTGRSDSTFPGASTEAITQMPPLRLKPTSHSQAAPTSRRPAHAPSPESSSSSSPQRHHQHRTVQFDPGFFFRVSSRCPGARREAAPDGPILSVQDAPPLQTRALSGDRRSAEALRPAQA